MILPALLAALLLLTPTTAHAQPAPTTPPQAFLDAAPPCPPKLARCFSLHLHIAYDDAGQPPQTPAWLAEQLRQANLLFEPLRVGFTLASATPLPPGSTHVKTRLDRDRIGRPTWPAVQRQRAISLHLVAQLQDVDIPEDVIRGVHWRDRAQRDRRWIILSAIAPPRVLAHELGHYFGLPHSTYDVSIMNKTPRAEPPYELRTFHEEELQKMRRAVAPAPPPGP